MPKRTKILILLLSLLFIGLVLISFIFLNLLAPVSSNKKSQNFIIPKGQAIAVIGQRLQEAGLIKSSLMFRLIVKQQNLTQKIQAGSFDLSPNMSLLELAKNLTKGTEDLWITVVEGWRTEEIAQMLAAESELIAFDQAEFLNLAMGNEGYLFPDTYLIPRQMDAAGIFNLFSSTFDKKVINNLSNEIEASPHSLEEVMIMASIVEREAKDDDMPQVAGILYNRLEMGMPLQADATLQYVKGYDKNQDSWWNPPLAADKQLESPFNTYLNSGLPPRPICNPGLKAIRAALEPQKTDYLYYIHDNQGKIHYAKTLEQHNANVNKYLR